MPEKYNAGNEDTLIHIHKRKFMPEEYNEDDEDLSDVFGGDEDDAESPEDWDFFES